MSMINNCDLTILSIEHDILQNINLGDIIDRFICNKARKYFV